MIEIIQWFEEPIPKIYRQCMDKIKEAALNAGFDYKLFTNNIHGSLFHKNKRYVSDEYRHILMIENPYRCWIDSDMLPIGDLSELKFIAGKPYCNSDKSVETFIYGNGCLEQIENWYHSIKQGISIQKMFELSREKYNTIPVGYFLHLHLGCMIQFRQFENDYCKIKKNEKDELEFVSINGYDIEKLRG
jgi:hypothetical protein